jgi:hypothetical protein
MLEGIKDSRMLLDHIKSEAEESEEQETELEVLGFSDLRGIDKTAGRNQEGIEQVS